MQITKRNVDLVVDDSLMRVYIAAPQPAGRYPGILFYSDIYQLGSPITRLANHLAGYGYVVAAPEIFHRIEPIGTVIEPNDLGRMQGNDDARRTAIAEYDADARAVIDFFKQDGLKPESQIDPNKIGTMGFCIGGHLAFRAAFRDEVKAAVCCYPTGIHIGKLGRGVADTLSRMGEVKGKVFLAFGSIDPHIPEDARQKVIQGLENAGVDYTLSLYEGANHTFMRDDSDRFDPVATDRVWAEVTAFLSQVFQDRTF
ncbi:MAG: dienelactone hydrolase family protein [Drouetiella hepatica Uher 2000/2452]|uniref:Dienelactone hydrolase family protein n=1 Tax=Drouetiella hepatica Uher 2000/2452 TaxID=904376 RepID=A0A951UMK0_9CYAN|nr:dienelactone hydrolase family protein [Drouetiella hepatica Uher 2000/2452]